ncbi:MAG: hypothetical protein A2Y17_04075 [Clostridiales bacterium GWF2_38_85]|nr:MAG: hypothetical protein A2Y17_04075 [Clostridiales bacterium GWF2_38_85]HBL83469.1 hypothetical protein [Clostridiales bacterium]
MAMNETPIKQMIEAALSNIKNVADANTVIGTPIIVNENITVIPFSKVSVGFASGGSDFGGKAPDKSANFAGGNGAGVTVIPLGFIIAAYGDVRVIDLKSPSSFSAPSDPVNKTIDTVNGLIDRMPDIIEKIKSVLPNKNKKTVEVETDITDEE